MTKYKLINIETKEEHLCDKVTIDGFDYYVSEKEMEIENGEDCFELHEEYESDKPRFIDSNNHKMSWWLRKLNMSYRQNSPKSFEFHRIFNGSCKKIIATTNPNINIPKVVDEVFKLSFDYFVSRDKIDEQSMYDFKEGYNKSQETHPFSEEDMIDFDKWKTENYIFHNLSYITKDDYYSVAELRLVNHHSINKLLQIWKEQRPKIVYYE